MRLFFFLFALPLAPSSPPPLASFSPARAPPPAPSPAPPWRARRGPRSPPQTRRLRPRAGSGSRPSGWRTVGGERERREGEGVRARARVGPRASGERVGLGLLGFCSPPPHHHPRARHQTWHPSPRHARRDPGRSSSMAQRGRRGRVRNGRGWGAGAAGHSRSRPPAKASTDGRQKAGGGGGGGVFFFFLFCSFFGAPPARRARLPSLSPPHLVHKQFADAQTLIIRRDEAVAWGGEGRV